MNRFRRDAWAGLRLLSVSISCLLAGGGGRSLGAEPLHSQIDRLIAFQTPGYEQLAAPVASDEEFLRRVWLDLAGTIPSGSEARAFLADADPQKREKLVDKLLASPEHARHMQRMFDLLLMRRLPQKNVPLPEWEKFLRDAFASNKSWDQIVREMLVADGSDPANRGAARFYLDRDGDANQITRDIGKLFLGVNLECAQCHNHPQIDDYRQDHYYGISAFYIRSFVMTDKEKRVVFAEKADGEVTFESVFEIRDKVSKGPKTSGMRLFEGLTISEPKFDKIDDAYQVKPDEKDKAIRPIPRFSRRTKFAEWVASADNRRFCRTTANRLWALLLGRGLVHPVDLDHSENPPSHPLLLALLTEEAAARQLNLNSLIREIVLSQTYQRSSRKGSEPGAPEPLDEQFAVAQLRPLTPAQLAWAMLQATGETDVHRLSLGDKLTEESLFAAQQGYEQRFMQLFGGEPGKPPESFESTTDQVLFLANDPAVGQFLTRKNGNLCDRLLKISEDNSPGIAEELYLSALTRMPTAEEIEEVRGYLAGQTGDPRVAAVQELIWALVTSSEFRFNH
ncbi:MAG: DUF1549 domain-containing protein [Planctomycetales bacterium]